MIGSISIITGMFAGCSPTVAVDSQKVFRLNIHENINTLDPAYARDLRSLWAMNQIFNGLVRLDHKLAIKPDIATHWEISDDAKTYFFYLRDDAYFHESEIFGDQQTRTVTASDFVYSFDRIRDKTIASPGCGPWKVKSYEAIDDYTLKIELTNPFSPFGDPQHEIPERTPKRTWDDPQSTIGVQPIGTGPFM